MAMRAEKRIRRHLVDLYGESMAQELWQELSERLAAFRQRDPQLAVTAPARERLSENDGIVITYGDQFRSEGEPPLRTLHDFLNTHLQDCLSGVHILPCFPYSSDDGFSVIDYLQVDPALGTWQDVAALGEDYRLMLDAVINHVSQYSAWFQRYLRDEDPYTDYFITLDPSTDLSQVVRPRALPLLTGVDTPSGHKHVWTTFSDDQIDLNYANPQVQLEIIDILLHYVEHGAEIIRLDAIAYLWKEVGTSCIHLPQTHGAVKLWRAVLDAVAPGVILITETNVPHQENISYFGEPLPETGSTDEAQVVYNFSLAPLTLHALQAGDATRLSEWADTLHSPSPAATFFNFIASHDGIGVRPAEGFLSATELQALVDQTLRHGGQVSYKANPDGSRSVYELNITLYDFLNDPQDRDIEMDVGRFLASQAILLSLAGVPGIYVHSLFGSRNCTHCVAETGRARSINREKFQRGELEAILADHDTHQHRVFQGYRHMLRQRRTQPAFHPAAEQRVLDLGPGVFCLVRSTPAEDRPVVALISVTGDPQRISLDLAAHSLPHPENCAESASEGPRKGPGEPFPGITGALSGMENSGANWRDLIQDQVHCASDGRLAIELGGYQVCWLVCADE